MAREDEGLHFGWSTVFVALFAFAAVAWSVSFARAHWRVYTFRRNYELWRIPILLNDLAAAEAQNPSARPYPEVSPWNGPMPVQRSR